MGKGDIKKTNSKSLVSDVTEACAVGLLFMIQKQMFVVEISQEIGWIW